MKKLFIRSSLLLFFLHTPVDAKATISGQSWKYGIENEDCLFSDNIDLAHRDAQFQCNFYFGANSKVVQLTVMKEWEARPLQCNQGGNCEHKFQCITDWEALCK